MTDNRETFNISYRGFAVTICQFANKPPRFVLHNPFGDDKGFDRMGDLDVAITSHYARQHKEIENV